MHRKGLLHVILSLPDGGTSLIPASWTNLELMAFPQDSNPPPCSIGTTQDLLSMRVVVDALLSRPAMTIQFPAAREHNHAAGNVSDLSGIPENPAYMEGGEPRTANDCRKYVGPPGDMIDSCGRNRKRTFLHGKVLSPNTTAGKENVREQDYHRDSNQGNARDHGGAGNHRA